MNRLAPGLAALGLIAAASTVLAAGPAAAPRLSAPAPAATPVVDVYIGGGYYHGRRYNPRFGYYPWYRPWYRPWYAYEPPVYYYPPPVVVVTQPPPQPVWTGAGVLWMFPGGAPQ